MKIPLKLTPPQIVVLVSVWRNPVGHTKQAVLRRLADMGLIRYTHNEFVFRWPPGCSCNTGWVLTPAGLEVVKTLRPPRNDEVLAALESIPEPTEAQKAVLWQLRFWKSTDDSGPDFTSTPVVES